MPSSIYPPRATVAGLEPTRLEVAASSRMPWRTARVEGATLPEGDVEACISVDGGELEPVFLGRVDDYGSTARALGSGTLRGLHEWREQVGPKSFQDVRLETLLTWIAGRCGGDLALNTKGALLRHYVLRQTSARQAVEEALAAWRDTSTLLELDGGRLYIGPEAQSPHALAGLRFEAARGENILELLRLEGHRYRLSLPLTPGLRVGHRGTVDHPLLSGPVTVDTALHLYGRHNLTVLEVLDEG